MGSAKGALVQQAVIVREPLAVFAGDEPRKRRHDDCNHDEANGGVLHHSPPSSRRTRFRMARMLIQAAYTPNIGPKIQAP